MFTVPRRLVGICLSLVATVLPRSGDVGAEPPEPAAQVEATEVAFAQTMAERDLDAFLTFIAPDAVFFAGETVMRGRDAINQAWAPFFDGPTAPFSWKPDQVEVLASGDLAFSSGPVYSAAGDSLGRFNSIWRRESDGRWLVVFDKGS